MDFGIAKSLQTESNLTQTGITLGTSAYLAPEQIRGEPIDRRTDIFALGVLAYELLTYRKPFRGEHLSTVLYKILNETPEPIETLVPDAPPALIAAVNRAMAKSRRRALSHDGGVPEATSRPSTASSPATPAVSGDAGAARHGADATPRVRRTRTRRWRRPSSGVAHRSTSRPLPARSRARPRPPTRRRSPASIRGARPPLELVNFRDPSAEAAGDETGRPAPARRPDAPEPVVAGRG